MKTSIKEKALFDVLQWCSLKKLPAEDDGSKEWILAVAKTLKYDGSESYCVLKNDINGKRVIKDFGNSCAISKFVSVYPYEYLKKTYVKKFDKYSTREDKENYIHGYMNINTSTMTDDEIEIALINVAKYLQLNGITV